MTLIEGKAACVLLVYVLTWAANPEAAGKLLNYLLYPNIWVDSCGMKRDLNLGVLVGGQEA